jgi:hypothetical protein
VLVQQVVEGSPAAALGLRGGVAKATVGGRTLIVGGDVLLCVQDLPVAGGGKRGRRWTICVGASGAERSARDGGPS